MAGLDAIARKRSEAMEVLTGALTDLIALLPEEDRPEVPRPHPGAESHPHRGLEADAYFAQGLATVALAAAECLRRTEHLMEGPARRRPSATARANRSQGGNEQQ